MKQQSDLAAKGGIMTMDYVKKPSVEDGSGGNSAVFCVGETS